MSIDTRLDITTAKAIFHFGILAPLVHEGVVDAKEFVKGLKAALREPATMTVAALCLLSSAGKVAHDNLAVEAVEGLFRSSFEDHKNSDGLISFSALSSTDTFKAWAAATGFDATSTANEDGKQHVNNFNDFEELSRLCERGGAQSGICLLKSAWLQEQFADAQRTGVPFVLPSRNALPSDAAHSGPITEDQVYIIALSYCWAGPGQPDPENRLLSDVCELLGYLDTSRHFGDDDPEFKKLNIGDREVLIFWDYPCLYQKADATTQGVTLLQLDSFERGLGSINVLYGHVGTLCLLCTVSYPVVKRTGYKDSAWPYFESLVSTMIKDQNRAVDLPTALSWVRRVGNNKIETDRNRSIYWLFQHVRRATRQLLVDPDTFDREIVAKHATNGSDVNFLKQKFRQTFHAVMTPAKKMELRNMPGPSPDHWRIFLTVTLRSCPQLVHVDLSRNEAIASTLEPFAALHGSLQLLSVSMSAGFGGTLQPLRGLRKLRKLYLYGCVALEGTVEPLANLHDLKTVDMEACFGLQGGLELMARLPKLRFLNACDTQLDTAAFASGGCAVGRTWPEATPLWKAADDGQVETARRLLVGREGRRGVEVDRARADNGATPLVQAASQNHPDMVDLLLEHRADVEKAKHDGFTPLLTSAQKGNLKITEILLEKRADINKTAKAGQTPLLMAARCGHKEMVVTLLAAGPDKAVSVSGWTALSIARENGFHEIAALLE